MAGLGNLDTILKKKDNVVTGVVIIIFLLITRNVYQAQMQRYNKLVDNIKIEQDKSEALDRIVVLNEKIKKIKDKTWATTETNLIVEKIYNLGLESDIKLRDVSPSEKKDEKSYVLIPFSLSFETSYQNFIKFVKKLETNGKFLRVRNVTIATGSDDFGREKNQEILKFSLTVDAIYLK